MRQKNIKQEQAFQYFLGELSDSERDALEERFFADEDYGDFLDEAEKQLVGLSAAGELGQKQSLNFEKHFLVSERRREMLQSALALQSETLLEKKKVIFFSLQEYFRQLFEKFFTVSNFGLASSFAAIAIFITLVIFWQQVDLPKDNLMAQLKNANEIESPKTFAFPIDEQETLIQKPSFIPGKSENFTKSHAEKRGKSSTKILPPKSEAISQKAFTLLPPVISTEKPLVVSTSAASENVRLRVVHDSEEYFVKYLVEIHASDGDLIWSREIAVNGKNLQKPLALAVRGGALTDGNYDLIVSGATSDGQLEEINNYNFTFRKE